MFADRRRMGDHVDLLPRHLDARRVAQPRLGIAAYPRKRLKMRIVEQIAKAVDLRPDDARAGDARALLAAVDARVQKLALILATMAVVLTTWFGLWMRSRAPQRFSWSR